MLRDVGRTIGIPAYELDLLPSSHDKDDTWNRDEASEHLKRSLKIGLTVCSLYGALIILWCQGLHRIVEVRIRVGRRNHAHFQYQVTSRLFVLESKIANRIRHTYEVQSSSTTSSTPCHGSWRCLERNHHHRSSNPRPALESVAMPTSFKRCRDSSRLFLVKSKIAY